MKKLLSTVSKVFMAALLVSCGVDNKTEEFKPALDTETNCSISIIGDYSNFEALETEFDRFNVYYPNVKLSYTKLDDYNKNLSTKLENEKPNIFFSKTWMIGNDKYNSVVSHMEELTDPKLRLDFDCIRPGLINRDATGKALMVPIFSRTYGTLVNNNLFKKENLKVPTTWGELVSTCETLANKGYKSPIMGYTAKSSSCLMNTIAYPIFLAELQKNPQVIDDANNLKQSAGVYMRSALETVNQLMTGDAVDLTECNKISDNYEKVILRFFEGDVPMMVCTGDTVSGTKKREEKSEAFLKSPFDYSYIPFPTTDKGGYFIDSPSVEFSVNKNCDNLDMTNEFMRFLISKTELNMMASIKRLVTPTKEMTFDPVYDHFGSVPAERTISPEVLGIKDELAIQIRIASYKVGIGELTIDEAIAQYGTFKD